MLALGRRLNIEFDKKKVDQENEGLVCFWIYHIAVGKATDGLSSKKSQAKL